MSLSPAAESVWHRFAPVVYHVIRHRSGDYGRVHLLYGARTPNDLLYTSEYDAWRAALAWKSASLSTWATKTGWAGSAWCRC